MTALVDHERAPELADDDAVLVQHLRLRDHGAPVGAALRRVGLDDAHAAGEDVAGAHRPGPAQALDPRRAEAGRAVEDPVDEQAHEHRRRVPAARGQAAEGARVGGLLVDVKRLRVVAPGELEDLLPCDLIGAELRLLADLEVLPVLHESSAR